MNKQDKGNGSRGIEWTDYTHNPIGGCLHGCAWTMPDGTTANCYAEDTAEGVARAAYPQGFEHHYWHPDQLAAPLKLKTPARIFVGSMADVFGAWVPDEQIHAVLDMASQAFWHKFQFLTKNAPRLLKFDFPPNVWVGASVPPTIMWGKELSPTQQGKMMRRTLDVLGQVKAAVRWMSIEPLSWDMSGYLKDHPLQWAVIGAATNGSRVYQPRPEWVENALAALEDTPIFFKGNLKGCPAATPWREEYPGAQPVVEPLPKPEQLGLFEESHQPRLF